MKVKHLIELLSNANPEDVVCMFTESGAVETTRVDVYEGTYYADTAPKLVYSPRNGIYVGIGNPGDFDATQSCEDCNIIFDLELKEKFQ